MSLQMQLALMNNIHDIGLFGVQCRALVKAFLAYNIGFCKRPSWTTV